MSEAKLHRTVAQEPECIWKYMRIPSNVTMQGGERNSFKSDSDGGAPYRPPSVAQHHRYRCSLPGLAELAASRRGETGTRHHKLVINFEGRALYQPTIGPKNYFSSHTRIAAVTASGCSSMDIWPQCSTTTNVAFGSTVIISS
jgi:hypothetical protein